MPSGGKRPGTGRPKKALQSRVDEGIGKVSHSKPKILDYPEEDKSDKLRCVDSPAFLNTPSKEDGERLPTAAEIYAQTMNWINDAGCERYVPKQLVEDYAITRRAFLECEWINKKHGRIVTGDRTSPYVNTALEYLKQANTLYREISSLISANASSEYGGNKNNTFLEMLANRGF